MLRWFWGEVRECPSLGFVLICMLAFIILLFLLPVGRAYGHDHSRPELNQWFKDLRASGSRAPCCDGSDATSLEDPDWDMKDGHYRVRLDGEWVNVPDEAVVTEPNRYGKALVWPYTGYQKGVRCFMPGSMG
ncbi:hypothetical protein QIH87_49905 (plasmid) [Bradyrhizobium elkanii]|jgi:hypothetical protein|uniref:hypothetical protein n=1 Tax=Bradyrhizobium elkanii TaxID=29448 RepID=UPI0027147FF7|nr:hypothetical protein [Bradyrhizobium elkanii]WLB14845.1 hypothetical protein QIH87_49905 [Bradyrhizobium elkanii]WLB69063.1 hypothetical protein QIH89_27500 [Bradyrhizobium elkanii]